MNTALIPKVPDPVERASQSAALALTFPAQTSRPLTRRHSRRRRGTQGAQLIEFTFNFLPFMVMILVLVDTAWAIYAQATIQQAVRMAVREGITLTTSSTLVNNNVTDTVKADVQNHAVGFLNGSTGKAYIQVHYFDQTTQLDVSGTTTGNRGGNVMQISVVGYPLVPLMPRFFSWKSAVDAAPMSMTVHSADVIEPISTALTAPIGSAP